MAYVIGGNEGESSAFEKTIANFAIEVLHENLQLVLDTTVVTPQQGVVYRVPNLAPVTFGDFDDTSSGNGMSVFDQTPVLSSQSITATPCLAMTSFSNFYNEIASFDFAASLGSELAKGYAEKVDQRVLKAFQGFNTSTTDGYYNTTTNAVGSAVTDYGDQFARIQSIGAVELVSSGTAVASGHTSTTNTVVSLINLIIKKWRLARNPGSPLIVLSPVEESRLLSELTNTASVGSTGAMGVGALSAAGNELQTTGMIRNFNGATIKFSTFLSSGTDTINGGSAETVQYGGAFSAQAIYTVMVAGLNIKLRERPNPNVYSLTGTGLLGAGVASQARGLMVKIGA
jgi:hypothetical protein